MGYYIKKFRSVNWGFKIILYQDQKGTTSAENFLLQAKPRRRRNLLPPSIEIPKGGTALWAAKPKIKGRTFGCPFVLEGAVKIDILDERDRCRRTKKRPFWAAARVRRASVFTAGENLGAGGIDFRRAFKYQRVEAASGGGNPKRKTRLTSCLSFWSE